ncbi:MAG: putative Ig domain-containing protein [Betaproteobacteria bacterium]|nr:putative Ig domain-containing protein [Betaproteobacteria bacterium]
MLADGSLPPGLSLDPASGRLSGVPTAVGTWTFTAAVTDGLGATAEQTFVLTIRPAPAPVPVNGALALALIALVVAGSGMRASRR